MPPANRKPRGRPSRAAQLERAKTLAADSGLRDLLTGIARDAGAGPWAEWAERLLESPEVRAETGAAGREK
jgi:hypothetical protein